MDRGIGLEDRGFGFNELIISEKSVEIVTGRRSGVRGGKLGH